MIQKRVVFENNKNELLEGNLRIPDDTGKFPAVIICHGFRANKEREIIFNIWDEVSRAGFICLRFDFSGHGESQGSFRDFTLSQEIMDLKAAYSLLEKHAQVDENKIGIIGLSAGAMVSILYGEKNKLSSLISISSKSSTEQFMNSYFSQYQQKELKRKGWIQLHDFGELSSDILDDSRKHNILESISRIKCPILIIHGTDDATTAFENARELFNHAPEPKRLELIDNADHHFSDDAHRNQLLDVIIDWLLRTLK